MQDQFEIVNVDAQEAAETSRRTFLSRIALAGIGLAALPALRLSSPVEAATAPRQPEAETGKSYPQPRPSARNEAQYRRAMAPIANLSLLASQIAVDKASNAGVREFANFELRESIGAMKVLREMNTPIPPLSARDRAILQQMRTLPRGAAFDNAYVTTELAGHEFLRDLAESYLGNSRSRSMAEMHGRHIATIQLAAFKEHVVHCKNLRRSMTGMTG